MHQIQGAQMLLNEYRYQAQPNAIETRFVFAPDRQRGGPE
jgi:hypothetical protein